MGFRAMSKFFWFLVFAETQEDGGEAYVIGCAKFAETDGSEASAAGRVAVQSLLGLSLRWTVTCAMGRA